MACMCHQWAQWSYCGADLSPASRTERKQGTVKEAELGANEELGQRVLKH